MKNKNYWLYLTTRVYRQISDCTGKVYTNASFEEASQHGMKLMRPVFNSIIKRRKPGKYYWNFQDSTTHKL